MDTHKFLPEAVSNLIHELNKLPSIGKKSAQRMAFYLIRQEGEDLSKLAHSILALQEEIQFCKRCYNLTEDMHGTGLCKICASPARNQKVVCVVEEVLDLIAIENTMEFNGVYHVLHGALSPLDGIGPDNLRLAELFSRVQESVAKKNLLTEKSDDSDTGIALNNEEEEVIEEIILATSTNSEGEATALFIHQNLKNLDVKISRIASGLPVGGDLDYADEGTLRRAMLGRSAF